MRDAGNNDIDAVVVCFFLCVKLRGAMHGAWGCFVNVPQAQGAACALPINSGGDETNI